MFPVSTTLVVFRRLNARALLEISRPNNSSSCSPRRYEYQAMAVVVNTFVPASIGFTYAAGLLTTLSPCVLPLLPLVIGGAMQRHRAAPLLMGIGMTTAFAVAGWVLGALGPSMGLEAEWVLHGAAISLIVFGLALWIDPLANLVTRLVQPLALSADESRRCSRASIARRRSIFWRPARPRVEPLRWTDADLVGCIGGYRARRRPGGSAAWAVRPGRGNTTCIGGLCVPLRLCQNESMGARTRRPTAPRIWPVGDVFRPAHRDRSRQGDRNGNHLNPVGRLAGTDHPLLEDMASKARAEALPTDTDHRLAASGR